MVKDTGRPSLLRQDDKRRSYYSVAERSVVTALSLTVLLSSFGWAEQLLIQPSSYGTSFDGEALRFECVALLKTTGPKGLVESFSGKSPAERRVCLAQLVQSLTPEPDFTAEDFQHSLKQNAHGNYELLPDPAIARKLTDRLGVNVHVAEGIAELAAHHLIEDSSVVRPLIECQNHPLLQVGQYCNRALAFLTRHTYGRRFFERSMGATPLTIENRQRVVADWRELDRQLRKGRPIFDESLESECLAAIRAVGRRLTAAVAAFPVAVSFLRGLAEQGAISHGTREETIIDFDVGSHTANWPGRAAVTRIALAITRPGVSQPVSQLMPGRVVSQATRPDYRELFPNLDLELRFEISTLDEEVRRASVLAVKEALGDLRSADARAGR